MLGDGYRTPFLFEVGDDLLDLWEVGDGHVDLVGCDVLDLSLNIEENPVTVIVELFDVSYN